MFEEFGKLNYHGGVDKASLYLISRKVDTIKLNYIAGVVFFGTPHNQVAEDK
jgi:hypothetical protein